MLSTLKFRLGALAIGLLLVSGSVSVASSADPQVGHVQAVAGDGYTRIARRLAPLCAPNGPEISIFWPKIAAANGNRPILAGEWLHYTIGDVPVCSPTTTTTTTTTSTTTTSTTTTTTQPVPSTMTTTVPTTGIEFSESFNGGLGGDRFHTIVDNRDGVPSHAKTFFGDHDMSCGNPAATSRTIHADMYDDYFYVCTPASGNSHWMTALGDVSGYSIAAFCPDADGNMICDGYSRTTSKTVSFEATITDLGTRRWWEIKIVPTSGPDLSVISWLAGSNGGPAHESTYPEPSFILGTGPFGHDFTIHTNGMDILPLDWQKLCGDFAIGGTYCTDHATRIPFVITDNGNGTITYSMGGSTYTINRTFTSPGRFPDDFKVIFADHAYTPTKDGASTGAFTTHWDNIVIK